MNRRLALGGVAAAAVGAGATWAWRVNAGDPDGGKNGEQAAAGVWSLRFAIPGGGELAMSTLQGRPLVLNFWATWCPPCLHEMPELDRFHREFRARAWQVLGIALDRPGPVNEFLAQRPVGFAIAVAGADGFDLIRRLGNRRGVLPFTVVFDGRGKAVRNKVGETTFDELSRWARAVESRSS